MNNTFISRLIILVSVACLCLTAPCAHAATYYVATTGNDANPGSQAAPFKTIQHGVSAAANGDTVQVAAGTYSEHVNWSNTGLSLLGAGAGKSVIDGGGSGTCLTLNYVPNTARVAGVTLQNGNIQDPNVGGGMYLVASSPTVSSCAITGNKSSFGAGMFFDISQTTFAASYPTITNCSITNNTIPYNTNVPCGGGMYVGSRCQATVTNCVFSNNTDPNGAGGFCGAGSTTISNSLFLNNGGAAVLATGNATITVTNCVLTGNSTGVSILNGGVYNYNTNVYVYNSILWGNIDEMYTFDIGNLQNSSVNNSDVQGADYGGMRDGGGNINADPRFVGGGNYRLQSSSPCLNRGRADASGLTATDLDGAPRILGGAPDMGAYELWLPSYGQWFADKALGSDTTGNGSPLAPYATVTKAIGAASAGNKIYIKAGAYGTDKPRITKSLHLVNWLDTGLSRIGKP